MYIISSVTLITKTKLRNFENTAFLHFLCSKISLNSRHFISPTIVIENDGTTLFFYSLLICRRVTRMSFRGRQHIEVFEGWILPGGYPSPPQKILSGYVPIHAQRYIPEPEWLHRHIPNFVSS